MTIDFNTLRKINVSENIERKGNLSYLSWTYAVDTLLQNDPLATWEFDEPKYYGETVMVQCRVHAFGKTMVMHLPVMDNRNQAVKNPDSRKISDSQMRCLAKCIACFGIGLYIYSGEDLPQDYEPEPLDIVPIVKSLKEAEDLDQLKTRYIAAVKVCQGNKDALTVLEFAKDNRKTDLEALASEAKDNQ